MSCRLVCRHILLFKNDRGEFPAVPGILPDVAYSPSPLDGNAELVRRSTDMLARNAFPDSQFLGCVPLLYLGECLSEEKPVQFRFSVKSFLPISDSLDSSSPDRFMELALLKGVFRERILSGDEVLEAFLCQLVPARACAGRGLNRSQSLNRYPYRPRGNLDVLQFSGAQLRVYRRPGHTEKIRCLRDGKVFFLIVMFLCSQILS